MASFQRDFPFHIFPRMTFSFREMSHTINTDRLITIHRDILGGGGGWREGYSRIWAIRGRGAEQGMFFWPRCSKQGIQFDLLLS